MTVGRVLAVIVLAAVILFPGVELIRFLFSDTLGLYQEMSLTDCLLFFVIVLLCALLLQRRTPDEPHLRAVGQKVDPPPAPRPPGSPRPESRASRPGPEPSPRTREPRTRSGPGTRPGPDR